MEAESSEANIIRNILQQVNGTIVSIGHFEGHAISSAQVAVLEGVADRLEQLEEIAAVDTPSSSQITQATTEEDGTRAARLQIAREIKRKQIELAAAPKANRPVINQDIGKLLSERARLDRLIKQFETATLI